MPSYIVTCQEDASDEDFQTVKQQCIDQGGKIGHEYTLIKGFSVTFEDGSIATLEASPLVKAIEEDGMMTTQ